MTHRQMLTSWLAAASRADQNAIQELSRESSVAVLEAAIANGVDCLVGHALNAPKLRGQVPDNLASVLHARVRCEQGIELVRLGELRLLVQCLRATQIRALLLKGAALAYTHYSYPHLRPRCDTDILIRPEDRDRVLVALTGIGYRRVNAVSRDQVFTQWMFEKRGPGRVNHILDLHWKISNRPLFRDILSFGELESTAIEIPAIGTGALTPGAVHSLLLACIHLVAHHPLRCRLIWLYDISLMAHSLNSRDWARLVNIGVAKKISTICSETLRLASRYFGTYTSRQGPGALDQNEQLVVDEPSAAYLRTENRRQEWLLDFAAIIGLRAKASLLVSHAFPDIAYMRAAYGASGPVSMVSAYGHRIVSGCVRLLRNDNSSDSDRLFPTIGRT